MRTAQIDHQTLVGLTNDCESLPDLLPDRYLVALHAFLGHPVSFWRSLVDASRHDARTICTAIINRVVLPPSHGIKYLSQTAEELLERCQTLPSLMPKVFVYLNLGRHFIDQYLHLRDSSSEFEISTLKKFAGMSSQLYDLFLIFDGKLKVYISKQMSALTLEHCQALVSGLSEFLQRIMRADESLKKSLLRGHLLMIQGLRAEEEGILVELAWRLDVLKRCIFEGRMEIRIQGVDSMQHLLVTVYTDYVKDSAVMRDHPLTQYLHNFMLDNKLVEYFVGVESHPQLVNRCGNIIGFLLVTGRYTDAETDVIWKAVTTSQDSRFVSALITMLCGTFNIAPYAALVYLSKKLNEVPVKEFDSNMIRFSKQLFDALRRKFKDFCMHSMEMPPFNLCIRLLRESTVEGSLEPSRKREIHAFAQLELRELLDCGPSDIDRRLIYEECIRDIADRTNSATGSISAINNLILRNPEKEIVMLCEVSNLASLAVGELTHIIEQERSSGCSLIIEDRIMFRLELLQHVITYAPHTITSDIGQLLWDFAVGSESLNEISRDMGWWCFVRATRSSFGRNIFVERCIQDYMPRLQAKFYCSGCINFVQDALYYRSRVALVQAKGDLEQVSTVGGILWQLALRAPPNTIETKAILMLVNLCLDSPDAQRRNTMMDEILHTELVGRCIHQLTSAAAKLRAFSDGTSSGEDEPMIHVTSDAEVQTEKLSFSRSLMILKTFMRGVRSRTQSNAQVHPIVHSSNASRDVRAERIQILYQVFGSDMTNDIRTLDVNDNVTVDEFQHHLNNLTGFSNSILIAGGGKVDMSKCSQLTLREWRVAHKGLVILKKAPNSDSLYEKALASGARPVELDVMKHFPELYKLLSMENPLGKEVRQTLLLRKFTF